MLKEEQLKLKLDKESIEKKHLSNIRKLSQEKIHLEEVNSELQIELKRLRT